MLFIICFLLTMLGVLGFYLTHPNQRLLGSALGGAGWRYLSVFLMLSGLLLAGWAVSASTAIFSWMVIVMLVFGLLPFAGVVFRRVDND